MHNRIADPHAVSVISGPPQSPLPVILVDARQASKLLAISPRTLWQLTKKHSLPSVKIGRSVRYRVADLEEWIRKQSTGV